MKGPVPSIRNSSEVTEPEVKIKRKCGRPRNPIPRHRRVSHITAEQRRRTKIQCGLQTLKDILPKYESTGRDSKADVLTKAVDYTKCMQKCRDEQEAQLQELRAQQQALNADIKRHQQNLPEGKLFDDKPLTAEQRFDNMVSSRTEENYKYFIFSYIMKPLHKAFEKMTDCKTLESFHDTTCTWANACLSQKGLRPVITEALRNLSTETSFIDKPDQMAKEALQRCHQKAKAVSATITSADARPIPQHHQSSYKQQTASRKHPRSHKAHATHKRQKQTSFSKQLPSMDSVSRPGLLLPSSAELGSRQESAEFLNVLGETTSATAVKTESLPSCSLPFGSTPLPATKAESTSLPKVETDSWVSYMPYSELPSHDLDSPLSIDSAIELSPQRSNHGSSVLGDLTGYESSLDQCYENDIITPASASFNEDFLQHRQSDSLPLPNRESLLGDLENFDLADFVNSITMESSSSSFPRTPHSQTLQPPEQSEYTDSVSAASSSFLDPNLLDSFELPLFDDTCLMDTEAQSIFDNGSPSLIDFVMGSSHEDHNINDPRLSIL